MPAGEDYLGVVNQMNIESAYQPEDRYIWHTGSSNGTMVIVGMNAILANRIHKARATVHDYTYKGIHGDFNEWVVALFDEEMNRRKLSLVSQNSRSRAHYYYYTQD